MKNIIQPTNDNWSAFIENSEPCELKEAIVIASEALEDSVYVYKIIRNETTINLLFELMSEFNIEFPAVADIYFAFTRYQDDKLGTKFKLVFFSLIKERSKADELLAGFDFYEAVDDMEYTQNFEREYAAAVAEQKNIRAISLIKKHNAMRVMYGEEYYDYNMLYVHLLSDVVATISKDLKVANSYHMVEQFMRFAGIHGSSEYFDGEHYSQSKSLSEKDKDLILNWFDKDNWVQAEILFEELGIDKRKFEKFAYGTTSGKYTYEPEYKENLHWITSNNTRLYNKLAVEWHLISRGANKPFIGFAVDKNLIKNIK